MNNLTKIIEEGKEELKNNFYDTDGILVPEDAQLSDVMYFHSQQIKKILEEVKDLVIEDVPHKFQDRILNNLDQAIKNK